MNKKTLKMLDNGVKIPTQYFKHLLKELSEAGDRAEAEVLRQKLIDQGYDIDLIRRTFSDIKNGT
jgi:hypothetical protein